MSHKRINFANSFPVAIMNLSNFKLDANTGYLLGFLKEYLTVSNHCLILKTYNAMKYRITDLAATNVSLLQIELRPRNDPIQFYMQIIQVTFYKSFRNR
jgi:hypothetical protein